LFGVSRNERLTCQHMGPCLSGILNFLFLKSLILNYGPTDEGATFPGDFFFHGESIWFIQFRCVSSFKKITSDRDIGILFIIFLLLFFYTTIIIWSRLLFFSCKQFNSFINEVAIYSVSLTCLL
jgi:hypothetical protein